MSGRSKAVRWGVWSLALLPLLVGADAEKAKPAIIKAADPKNLKLALVVNNASEYWKLAQAGMNKYGKESETTFDMEVPARGNAADQKKLIDKLLDAKYDGIGVVVVDPGEEKEYLAGIGTRTNLICVDVPCPQANPVLSIYTDNVAAGRAVGEHLVKLMPDGGKIAVVCGRLKTGSGKDRLDGIKEAIKDHKIEVAAEVEDGADRAKAVSATEDMLTAHPEVTVVVGLWSYEGPALAMAAKDAQPASPVTVVAFDQEQATLKAVENGSIESTFVSDPYKMGYETARWLHDLAVQGDAVKLPKDNKICPAVRMIDKSNVEDYRKEQEEIRKAGNEQ